MQIIAPSRGEDSSGAHRHTTFRQFLEKFPAAAYTCDAEGMITSFNDRAVQLWGREPQLNDPVDRYCGSLRLFQTDGSPVSHDECWVALALKSDVEYNGQETVIERPDGTRRIVLVHISPLHDAQGKVDGAVNVLVDITERKRSETMLAERSRLIALRGDISMAFNAAQPTQTALQQCCDALVQQLDVAFARVWTLNERESMLELQASAGIYTHLDGTHSRVRLGQWKIGRIAHARQPHLTNSVTDDPNISDREWARREGMVAFAGYPLLVEDRCVGVLAMFARQALTESILSELAPLADGIAQYIDRKQAEERLREESRIAERLHRIGRLLAAELDLDKLVDAVTAEATKLTEAEFGAFFYNVQNKQGESYLLYALAGVPREAFAGFPMPRNTAIFAPTFHGAGPVRIDDVTVDPRYGKNDPYCGMPHGHLPVRSYLAVPVVSRSGEVLGGLFFGHSQPGVFTGRHESLALGVASQAAVAVDNARLFRKAREQASQLELKAAELAHQRQWLEAVLNLMPVPTLFIEPGTGRVTFSNRAADELAGGDFPKGRPGEEYHTVYYCTDASGRRIPNEQMPGVRVARGERLEAFEMDWHVHGARRSLVLWADTLPAMHGHPATCLVMFHDISLLKTAETNLRKQSERLRLLWESAATLLTAGDPQTMMRDLFDKIGPHLGLDTYFNYMVDEANETLHLASCQGISEETARTITSLEFGQALCGAVAMRRLPMVATDVQQSADATSQLVKSLGIQAYACYPLLAAQQLIGTLSFASRDRSQFDAEDLAFLETITHYVTLAYERLRLIKRLQQADRRKDEFLATLAHELRNPLAPIRNALEVMHKADADPALRAEARKMMERQLAQLVRLVDDLLDVSRITTGKMRLRRERIELSSVVQSSLEATRPFIAAQNHELSVSLPTEPLILDADPTRIAQVFANLLNNASKYTERGGRIWLSAERQGNRVVVTVGDTGIGIAAEHLPRIFEIFSQVAPALERSHGGLGIGLSLVHGLVEMHGGTIEARSEGPGRGSVFTVSLPLVEGASHPLVETGKVSDESLDEWAIRILVVDDNRDAAESLRVLLQLHGHHILTAYDGAEAIQVAERFQPDLVLLDIGLPSLSGYEVARCLRATAWGKKTVLVAVTGWGQDDDIRRAMESGFDEHITKPMDPTAISRLLKAVSLASRG